MTSTREQKSLEDKRKEEVLQGEKEGIITSKQAKALLTKIEGKRLSTKNRTYIYSLKQIIERGEKNMERVEALKSLLLFLGIPPEIGQGKEQLAEKICYHCNTQTVCSIQHLYRETPIYTLILEDIPVYDCPICDEFYLANDTLKVEDQILKTINQEIKAIQEQSFSPPDEQQPCPVCHYKYLTPGKTEVYRFRRHEFHLILRDVPVHLSCPQCGYLFLHDKTTLAIEEIITLIHNLVPKLRTTGWRGSKND